MPPPSKREQIISTALQLFYKLGITNTGIDLIISEAQVSKKTLYHHFKSKDKLIIEVLRKRDELFRNNLISETEKLANTPKERLLALFDVMNSWFHQEDFNGCMFINVSGELSDPNSASRLLCAEHKQEVFNYIHALAKDTSARNPKKLSSQLNLLIEGSIVLAHVTGNKKAAHEAKEMGEVFINIALC